MPKKVRELQQITDRYATFAAEEAQGVSHLYERLARAVAGSDEVLESATLVVFHSAVLGYVSSKADRERFAREVQRSRAVWISNEVPGAFPGIAKATPPAPRRGLFRHYAASTPKPQ